MNLVDWVDELSAFKYENYLQKLKKMIRSASNPLVQVAKRTYEYEAAHLHSSANSSHLKNVAKGRDSTVMLKMENLPLLLKFGETPTYAKFMTGTVYNHSFQNLARLIQLTYSLSKPPEPPPSKIFFSLRSNAKH